MSGPDLNAVGRRGLKLDLARYPKRPWLKEQSIWAIAVYRFGRYVDLVPLGFRRWWLNRFYWAAFRIVETITGITLPKEASIGPGLRIWHFGGIVIHPEAVIGSNCTLRHGVTIGVRVEDGPVPRLGDFVDVGAYAQILGDVVVGDQAKIGALCVVLDNVPEHATAVGYRARVIEPALASYQADERNEHKVNAKQVSDPAVR